MERLKADLVECVARELDDVEGIEDCATVSGSSSRIALRYPRNGCSAAYLTDTVTSTACSLSQSAYTVLELPCTASSSRAQSRRSRPRVRSTITVRALSAEEILLGR